MFPNTPRLLVTEIFVNGKWTDITTDVRVPNDNAVTITRGARNEQTRSDPQRSQLVIDNRSGNYSPRNPMGVSFNSIGRNTPLRQSVTLLDDRFATRTSVSGWGTADTAQTYTLTGTGGTVQASDWKIPSLGTATVSVPVAGGSRVATPSIPSIADVDVRVDMLPLVVGAITGNGIFLALIDIRKQLSGEHAYGYLYVDVGGIVYVAIYHSDGTSIGAFTATGLDFTRMLSLRLQAESQTFRLKAWDTLIGEPYDWTLVGHTAKLPYAGGVDLYCSPLAGNTNTYPISFAYTRFTVGSPRFFGEVTSWPQRWDITGKDSYVPIEATGIKRRLGQGTAPLRSALYRYNTKLALPPAGYWPGDDFKFSGSVSSGVGGSPLTPRTGFLEYAAYTDIPAAGAIFKIGASNFDTTNTTPVGAPTSGFLNYVPAGATTTVSLVFNIPPTSGAGDDTGIDKGALLTVFCTGTSQAWVVEYRSGGFLEILAGSGVPFYDVAASVGFDIRGRKLTMILQFFESGGNLSYDLNVQDIATGQQGSYFDTVAGKTLGQIYNVGVDMGGANGLLAGNAYGHIAVRNETVLFADLFDAARGHSGETALDRLIRLCDEESISFSYAGNPSTTTAMGPQGAAAVVTGSVTTASLTSGTNTQAQILLDLLYECEDADMGFLHEPKGTGGFLYRTRTDVYGQAPQITLDYGLGQVSPPMEPTDDDQLTQNDIVATNVNAGSAEATLTAGRLSTLDPSAGGVGSGYGRQYILNTASDTLLAGLAAFLLTKGTVDEARFPIVTVDLTNSNVVAAGLEPSVLDVAIGDRLVVANPKAGLTADQINLVILGYTETIGLYAHKFMFNCAPFTPYAVLRLDTGFKVDSDTSTLVSPITSTATTMSVANVSQPWTTDPTQWPIPIIVGGELMSVTAVSGSSTPQSFTVTRSVNSVVKAQLAGTVVQISRPSRPIIGL